QPAAAAGREPHAHRRAGRRPHEPAGVPRGGLRGHHRQPGRLRPGDHQAAPLRGRGLLRRAGRSLRARRDAGPAGRELMRRFRQHGMTMVEMLIAMAILGIVLLVTSSAIIQALQVNRLAEDATNTKSKLRRITEVISQELRSAVLGGLTNYPVNTSGSSISFALLSGDGGLPVFESPGQSWHTSVVTYVYASDDQARQDLVGAPAVIINGLGEAVVIDQITGAPGHDMVQHVNCQIPIDYTPNTRIYSASAL